MLGRKIGQYEITEKLGEGGMGIVYKAHDTRLDRDVALKFLPQHLTPNEAENARFLQEARAAAALNHPNVCSVIDIQESDGVQFIVMEFIDGVTLRRKIAASRPAGLPIDEAVSCAIQIGEALQEAHARNIVHRDVKSENIMVNSKNSIKVMDFGLAKLKGSLKLTRTSSTIGTLAYMAPEQIEGREVDARSDIFSLGIVLFEMLTGQMPFRGEHDAAMMYSILNEPPAPLQSFLPDAPSELTHIIDRALEKNPADRYQSAADMVIDLRRLKRDSTRVAGISRELPSASDARKQAGHMPVTRPVSRIVWAAAAVVVLSLCAGGYFLFRGGGPGAAPAAGKNRLAVLPFENMGPADQEYFADGITEEVTSRLSGLTDLGVIARTSAMQYKKTAKTVQQIGSELNVDYVLQGTVRWAPSANGTSRVRVNPALIKVSDGTQVWSQPFDAEVADAFKLQSDIATQVVSALGLTLGQEERASLQAKPTENADAYDLYLRGMQYYSHSYGQQDFEIAIELFEKAVGLDPRFVLAEAKLSEANSAMYWFHFDHTAGRLAKAKEAADKASALDANSPDVHLALGYYYYWGFLDYDNALREFDIVRKTRPNDSRLHLAIGSVYRREGKMKEAIEWIKKATELDPRSGELTLNLGQTYRLLRDYPASEQALDRSIMLRPDASIGYLDKVMLYLVWDADTKRARKVLDELSKLVGTSQEPLVAITRMIVAFEDHSTGEMEALLRGAPVQEFESQYFYTTRTMERALMYWSMHDDAHARPYFDSAAAQIRSKLKEQPDDARYHSALGIVLAGLGKSDEAAQEGKTAVSLLPVSKEAWRGSYRVFDLAKIDAMLGRSDEAIDLLRQLLSMPAEFSANSIRRSPFFAALRDQKRFQQLVGSAAQ